MLSCIVCMGQNREIGKNNKMPWYIKEDLIYFKKTTIGKTIVMGRKTFESLPKVLPNRKHIVITKNKNYSISHDDVLVVHDIDFLRNYKREIDETFVIGGSEIYKQLMPIFDKIYITKIYKNFEADVFFPNIDMKVFNLRFSSKIFYNEYENVNFNFEIYGRNWNE
ncbi:MAG: dihydrofolate reductase [Defluviitaleaceae bacterium]|nr:dihydrofolate reductase [Defluviitaleaceae bacterium]